MDIPQEIFDAISGATTDGTMKTVDIIDEVTGLLAKKPIDKEIKHLKKKDGKLSDDEAVKKVLSESTLAGKKGSHAKQVAAMIGAAYLKSKNILDYPKTYEWIVATIKGSTLIKSVASEINPQF